jgi:hypothetical protein
MDWECRTHSILNESDQRSGYRTGDVNARIILK